MTTGRESVFVVGDLIQRSRKEMSRQLTGWSSTAL